MEKDEWDGRNVVCSFYTMETGMDEGLHGLYCILWKVTDFCN